LTKEFSASNENGWDLDLAIAPKLYFDAVRDGLLKGVAVSDEIGWDLDLAIDSKAVPDPPQARKLHLLAAIDLNARKRGGNIGPHCKVSYDKLHRVLSEIFFEDADKPERRERIEIRTLGLDEEDVSPQSIINYYRNIDVGNDDVLVFYYAGHGGWDVNRGHFLAMSGRDFFREDLRAAMTGRHARSIIILTDCCSNYGEFTPPARRAPAKWPGFQNLFFQSRGIVDIQAASESQFGWLSRDEGGFFTSALTYLLCEPIGDLEADKDGFLTWNEFFPQLRDATDRNFDKAKEQAPNDADIKGSTAQVPQAFNLAYWPENRRYFKVVNHTGERLSLCLQYFTRGPNDRWSWYPDANKVKYLQYSLDQGEETLLKDGDFTIKAYLVQFWATSKSSNKAWRSYGKGQWPLRLAPFYGYPGEMCTFNYTFEQ
jgi:hypothetical protein